MTKVFFDISVSLDGYMTAAGACTTPRCRGGATTGPTGDARVPVFVVTRDAPSDAPPQGVYTFVTDGIDAALEQAKVAAGDKHVTVMRGAEIGQQYLRAGLIDELSVHRVRVGLVDTAAATHLRLRVIRRPGHE
jgi:hypothetical protein